MYVCLDADKMLSSCIEYKWKVQIIWLVDTLQHNSGYYILTETEHTCY